MGKADEVVEVIHDEWEDLSWIEMQLGAALIIMRVSRCSRETLLGSDLRSEPECAAVAALIAVPQWSAIIHHSIRPLFQPEPSHPGRSLFRPSCYFSSPPSSSLVCLRTLVPVLIRL
jgi:hypothetical protein